MKNEANQLATHFVSSPTVPFVAFAVLQSENSIYFLYLMHANILHRIAVMWVPLRCQLCATCNMQHTAIWRTNRKCSWRRATNSRLSLSLLLFSTFPTLTALPQCCCCNMGMGMGMGSKELHNFTYRFLCASTQLLNFKRSTDEETATQREKCNEEAKG